MTRSSSITRCVETTFGHVPVLARATLELWTRPDLGANDSALYVDGTTGLGGHSEMLLDATPTARLLCVDRDDEMLGVARTRLARFGSRVAFARGSFADLPSILGSAALPPRVDGVLLDLGINSEQLATPERGFSFMNDGPLDMRFDRAETQRPTAAELIGAIDELELSALFRDYGGEPRHATAARAVVRWRGERAAAQGGMRGATTAELAEVIGRALPLKRAKRGARGGSKQPAKQLKGKKSIHPATRCFQALRIAVNDELGEVDTFLRSVLPAVLKPAGGRAAIISFHSLEDRRVKRCFKSMTSACLCPRNGTELCFEVDDVFGGGGAAGAPPSPRRTPATCARVATARLLTRKARVADAEETRENPRARSARLRAIALL